MIYCQKASCDFSLWFVCIPCLINSGVVLCQIHTCLNEYDILSKGKLWLFSLWFVCIPSHKFWCCSLSNPYMFKWIWNIVKKQALLSSLGLKDVSYINFLMAWQMNIFCKALNGENLFLKRRAYSQGKFPWLLLGSEDIQNFLYPSGLRMIPWPKAWENFMLFFFFFQKNGEVLVHKHERTTSWHTHTD